MQENQRSEESMKGFNASGSEKMICDERLSDRSAREVGEHEAYKHEKNKKDDPGGGRKNNSNNDFDKDDTKNDNKDQNKLTAENENLSTKPENLRKELKHIQAYIPAPTRTGCGLKMDRAALVSPPNFLKTVSKSKRASNRRRPPLPLVLAPAKSKCPTRHPQI